ncbi:MAG: OmpH family outer membrane protein [Alphaproteobacteria bacterium]|nr:OmpH family outer membrane protein [Alphaproteobacteria bacterium]
MTKRIALLIGFWAMLLLAAPAFAADEPAPAAQTFGVIDMNKVMQITNVAKDIFSQMEVKRKEYQANISKEETSLRAAEQEILKQKDSLSKDEFEKKRKEFEEKVVNGQKLVQERKRILDQAFSSSMGNLRGEAIKIVAEVAKERNYSAVFTQDAVMISTPNLDMTDVVIERMNKQVKKIPIDWSASTAAVTSVKK